MSPENLLEFLVTEQRDEASLADAHSIIEKYEPDDTGQYTCVTPLTAVLLFAAESQQDCGALTDFIFIIFDSSFLSFG